MVFHPTAGAAYVINELDSTLVVCEWNPEKCDLTVLDTLSTRADSAQGENLPAELLISDDGRYLYGSNRGDDTIAVFATHQEGRQVELVQVIPVGGSWPRHLAFSADQSTLYAANERGDSITSFAVGSDGTLKPSGTPLSWPKPVCILPV